MLAKIFLADQRPCEETDWYRKYSTHKLADITLAADRALPLTGYVIPLVGLCRIDGEWAEPGEIRACKEDVQTDALSNFLCVEKDAYLRAFNGREEAVIHCDGHLFVYVITGAFEVQGRLLHDRDGLQLSGFTEIELEALSNNAIILISA